MVHNKDIASLRKDYTLKTFDESHLLSDPLEQFKLWFKEALESEVMEPNAMTLATVQNDGKPSARVVLLKGIHNNGFLFYTNYNSNKGKEIQKNPYGALVFFWPELQRQVRIEGIMEKGNEQDADEYFNSRPLESRIGAYASNQSETIGSRKELDDKYESYKLLFEKEPLLRPPHWGGYVLMPKTFEFWQGRSSRLHDRFLFSMENQSWKIERLSP